MVEGPRKLGDVLHRVDAAEVRRATARWRPLRPTPRPLRVAATGGVDTTPSLPLAALSSQDLLRYLRACAGQPITQLDLRDCALDAEHMHALAQLPNLEHIELGAQHADPLSASHGLARWLSRWYRPAGRVPLDWSAIGPGLAALRGLRRLTLSHLGGGADGIGPHLACLAELRSLTFRNCPELSSAIGPHLARLASLTELSIADARGLDPRCTPHLAALTQLERLELGHADAMGEAIAEHLAALPHLRDVALHYGADHGAPFGHALLSKLTPLAPRLERLALHGCAALDDGAAAVLATCVRLTHLSLRDCPRLTAAVTRVLPELPNLEAVDLSGTSVGDLCARWIAHCPRLSDLRLSRCRSLTHAFLTPLADVGRLRVLHLDGAVRLDARIGADLARLEALTELRLGAMTSHIGPELARLTRLERLTLDGSALTATIGGNLRALPALTELSLEHLGDNPDCANGIGRHVQHMLQLRKLSIQGATRLPRDFTRYLAGLDQLEELRLDGAAQLDDGSVDALLKLPRLATLSLTGCPALTDAATRRLAALPQLRSLGIDRGAWPGHSGGDAVVLGRADLNAIYAKTHAGRTPAQFASTADFPLERPKSAQRWHAYRALAALAGDDDPQVSLQDRDTWQRAVLDACRQHGVAPPNEAQCNHLEQTWQQLSLWQQSAPALREQRKEAVVRILRTLRHPPSLLAELFDPHVTYDRSSPYRLDLSGLGLSSLPELLGELAELRRLEIGHNELTALPANICDLTELRDLRLDGNHLAELPAAIGKLRRLRWLSFRRNPLTELPAGLGHLLELTDLVGSPLTVAETGQPLAPLPPSLCQLRKLSSLVFMAPAPRCLPAELRRLADAGVVLYLADRARDAEEAPPELPDQRRVAQGRDRDGAPWSASVLRLPSLAELATQRLADADPQLPVDALRRVNDIAAVRRAAIPAPPDGWRRHRARPPELAALAAPTESDQLTHRFVRREPFPDGGQSHPVWVVYHLTAAEWRLLAAQLATTTAAG